MLFENKIIAFLTFVTFREVVGDSSDFRVLAPEFVCPSNEEAVIEKPDNTIITVKTDVPDLQLTWIVRWSYLDGPSQRFTLLLWKTVRALEAKLNAPQPEPFVYIIDNAELLQGVEYIFNVTAFQPDEPENSTTKWFYIDNIKGDPKLLIEGRSDKLSVLLLGGEMVYADMEYVIEATVTTCTPTQDYYFVWSVQSASASLKTSNTSGSRLEIAPYSLLAGAGYYVSCSVYRNSGEFVTQTGLPFQVLYRGLAVNLNLDVLVVTANNGFDLKAVVENHDYFGQVLNFEWSCNYGSEPCENFESIDDEILNLHSGILPHFGQYDITLMVSVQDQHASANATIFVVEPNLPVIQIEPQLHRTVNEHSIVTLVANASKVAPSCTLTWYFIHEEQLASLDNNDSCSDCQLGEALSGSITIFSLEENFLNELTDFTNETESRQLIAEMDASAGRARFVAQCGCSLTFSCDTQGIVHGDVNFKLNYGPTVADIKVSPETGTAMETVFRLSTIAASDPDKPLRYSFYCSLGTNETLILASNLEQLAVETFLPFDATGTNVWVEVCDSLGACSSSEVKTVQLLEGEAKTVQMLLDSIRGHVNRCEMMLLKRVVKSAVTTYANTNQVEVLSTFVKVSEILQTAEERCIKRSQDYYELLQWLTQAAVDTNSSIE